MSFPFKSQKDVDLTQRIVSRADIEENFEEYRNAISFYRMYPDKLVDLFVKASGPECTFKLYPYQRIMLRALARYTDVNLTFSRGTSKTFMNILWQMIKCILYPGTKSAVCASTKGQSAKLITEKYAEITDLIPAFKFEEYRVSNVKDDVKILFKNGSWIVNVGSKGSTRGQRQNSITVEEINEQNSMVPSAYKIKSNICWNTLKNRRLKRFSERKAAKAEKTSIMIYGLVA